MSQHQRLPMEAQAIQNIYPGEIAQINHSEGRQIVFDFAIREPLSAKKGFDSAQPRTGVRPETKEVQSGGSPYVDQVIERGLKAHPDCAERKGQTYDTEGTDTFAKYDSVIRKNRRWRGQKMIKRAANRPEEGRVEPHRLLGAVGLRGLRGSGRRAERRRWPGPMLAFNLTRPRSRLELCFRPVAKLSLGKLHYPGGGRCEVAHGPLVEHCKDRIVPNGTIGNLSGRQNGGVRG